jgi:hypothetical protein
MPTQSSNPFELHTLDQWSGLNQQAKRGSIADSEEWWNENLFAVGPGNLRSCWGIPKDTAGNYIPIYTAPAGKTILRIFFGFIGNETGQFNVPPPGRLGWMFLDDGTIDQVDLDTKVVTNVGGAGTIIWNPVNPQYWASAVVWRPQFFGNQAGEQGGVLFGSPEKAPGGPGGLYAWDGTTLFPPGSTAPDWLTNELATSGTTGTFIMPEGLPGIFTMEVYQNRLWVSGKDVISFSAPGNGADFSTVDGGGSIGYFGNKLVYTYNDMAASSGYLYLFGDSSIDMISNVQTTGGPAPSNPVTTTFSYTNIDPQVGQRFPRPVGRAGRYMTMWTGNQSANLPTNPGGGSIFQCRGAEAGQISQKATNLLNTLDPSTFLPTMCSATMFGSRVVLCLGQLTDIFEQKRSLILIWHPMGDAGFWSVASQNVALTNISSYEQDSIITPYGTDGTHLFQLFAQPDPTLQKYLATKYLRGAGQKQIVIKNWKRLFLEFHDELGTGVAFNGRLSAYGGGIPGGIQDIGFQSTAGEFEFGLGPVQRSLDAGFFEPQRIEGAGIAAAVDLWSYSPDFVIERLHLGAEDRTLFGA